MTPVAPIRVFIAEDEQPLAHLFAEHLTSCGHVVRVAHDGRAALEFLSAESFDVALLDVAMPEMSGLDVLRHVRAQSNAPEVVMVTGNGSIEMALTALRLGAYDFLSKPCRLAELEVIVRRAHERRALARANVALETRLAHVDPTPDVVTVHPRMQELLAVVERFARSEAPVLIVGESGTGKELIARCLHRLARGREGPFVDVNCAAMGGVHVEYELFGYEAGTAPGSSESRVGTLELASGGTLFLDEISVLEHRLQAALSRVIGEGCFTRAGGSQKVALNARLVAATNRDLPSLVSSGVFRDDLFFRINALTIVVPPLRERPDDILLLAEHFLRRFSGGRTLTLDDDAVHALSRYGWPGNVRELRNVMERAVLMAEGDRVGARDLPFVSSPAPVTPRTSELTSLADVERDHIRRVLESVQWHQGRAAAILGISSKTLYRKIREFGFSRPNHATGERRATAGAGNLG